MDRDAGSGAALARGSSCGVGDPYTAENCGKRPALPEDTIASLEASFWSVMTVSLTWKKSAQLYLPRDEWKPRGTVVCTVMDREVVGSQSIYLSMFTDEHLHSLRSLFTQASHNSSSLRTNTVDPILSTTMSGTGASGGSYYTYPCMYAHVVEGHSQAFMFYSPNEKCEACRVRIPPEVLEAQLNTR